MLHCIKKYSVLCNSFPIKWQETFSNDIMQVSQKVAKDKHVTAQNSFQLRKKAVSSRFPSLFHGRHCFPVKTLQLSLG